MTAWKNRQRLGLCQYPCPLPACDGDYCDGHAPVIRANKLRWWHTRHARPRRPKQLCLVLISD